MGKFPLPLQSEKEVGSRGTPSTWVELISDRWFAYVGAVVTIISLAFGTFVQQLLAFENMPITDVRLLPGNIPRSQTWQNWTGNPAEAGLLFPNPFQLVWMADISSVVNPLDHESRNLQRYVDREHCSTHGFLSDRKLYMAYYPFHGCLRGMLQVYI